MKKKKKEKENYKFFQHYKRGSYLKKTFAQTKRVNALFFIDFGKRFLREYYVTAKFDEVTRRLCLIASIK